MLVGQPEDALKDSVIARQLRPTWPEACFRMAVARLELARYQVRRRCPRCVVKPAARPRKLRAATLITKVKKGTKVHQETEIK